MTKTHHWCVMRSFNVEVLERFDEITKQVAPSFPVKNWVPPAPEDEVTGCIHVMTLKSTTRADISMLVRNDPFLRSSEYEYCTMTRHVHTPEPPQPQHPRTMSRELVPDRVTSSSPLQSPDSDGEIDGRATSRGENQMTSVASTSQASSTGLDTHQLAPPQAPAGEAARENPPANIWLPLAPVTMGPATVAPTMNDAPGPYTIGNGIAHMPATASPRPPWEDPTVPPCSVCHRGATVWMVETKDWIDRPHLAIPFCESCALAPHSSRIVHLKHMDPSSSPVRDRQVWTVSTEDPRDRVPGSMSTGTQSEDREVMQQGRKQGKGGEAEEAGMSRSKTATMSRGESLSWDSDDSVTSGVSGVSLSVCLSGGTLISNN